MSLKVAIALFIAYCVGSVVMAGEAYLFEHMLNPTLPLFPAAMMFISLWLAGMAGKTWAENFSDEEEAK